MKFTQTHFNNIIRDAGIIDPTTGIRKPYEPWEKHQKAVIFTPFLVTGDRMRRWGFNYGRMDKVFSIIDPSVYAPMKQSRILLWGSNAEDLCKLLVYVNSALSNYLDKILVISLIKSDQAGWYLENSPYNNHNHHPKWSTHLPNLSHSP